MKDIDKYPEEVLLFDFVYSDPHFGHKNVITYSGRPFIDKHDMEEKLIKNYNSVVGPEHTVLWTGDCFFLSNKKAREIMARLNGRKILVRGNHDPGVSQCLKRGFDFVVSEMVVPIQGHRVRISHYPYWPSFFRAWYMKLRGWKSSLRYKERRPPKIKGEALLHGHTHSSQKVNGNMICVCVEAWGYKPAPIKEIASILSKMQNEGVIK